MSPTTPAPPRRDPAPALRRVAASLDPRATPVLWLNGAKLRASIAAAVTDAQLELTLDGASTLTLTLRDRQRRIARSELVRKGCTIRPGQGQPLYALVRAESKGAELTLTFEDASAVRLREKIVTRQMSKEASRWQLVRALIRSVKPTPRFVLGQPDPSLDAKRKPKAPPKTKAATSVSADPPAGSATDPAGYTAQTAAAGSVGGTITVKGQAADTEQREMITRMLRVCDQLGAPRFVMEATIACATQESDCRNLAGGDRDSVGLFQQRPSMGWGTVAECRDPERATKLFLTKNPTGPGALALYADHPDWSVAQLAQEVQRSAFPDAYQQWAAEARRTVASYLGSPARASNLREGQGTASQGQPDTQEPESVWDTLGRLAEERAWRRFALHNVVYVVPDRTLTQGAPAYVLDPTQAGVVELSWSLDRGEEVSEATLELAARRIGMVPGVMGEIVNAGPPDGRWLVSGVTRSLYRVAATATLVRPRPELPEPQEPTTNDPASGGIDGSAVSGSVRERIVAVASDPAILGKIQYEKSRPIPHPTGGKYPIGRTTDCSGWATFVYEAAGAPCPGASSYDGSGSTVTMQSYGRNVAQPEPGDLVFYGTGAGNAGHVVVYLGDGKVSSQGGGMGPKIQSLNYRTPTNFRAYVE